MSAGAGEGERDIIWRRDVRQFDEPDATGIIRDNVGTELKRETGLAASADPYEGDQSLLAQTSNEVLKENVATDEARELKRKIVPEQAQRA